MILVCSIVLAIKFDGLAFIQKVDVQGTKISESSTTYLVDFSNNLGEYNLAGKPEDYSKVLVDKKGCVKL